MCPQLRKWWFLNLNTPGAQRLKICCYTIVWFLPWTVLPKRLVCSTKAKQGALTLKDLFLSLLLGNCKTYDIHLLPLKWKHLSCSKYFLCKCFQKWTESLPRQYWLAALWRYSMLWVGVYRTHAFLCIRNLEHYCWRDSLNRSLCIPGFLKWASTDFVGLFSLSHFFLLIPVLKNANEKVGGRVLFT